MMAEFNGWLIAFLLTLAVELVIAYPLLALIEPSRPKRLVLVLLANFITHPLVYFAVRAPWLIVVQLVLLAELAAAAIEAVVYAKAFGARPWLPAVFTSFFANSASLLVSLAVHTNALTTITHNYTQLPRPLVLHAGGLSERPEFNSIDERTPATQAAISAVLPDGYYDVQPKMLSVGGGIVIPGFAINTARDRAFNLTNGDNIAVVFPEDGHVGTIKLTSAAIPTEDGLRIGSPFSELALPQRPHQCSAVIDENVASCTLSDTGIVYELAVDLGAKELEGAALDMKLRNRTITAIRWSKAKDR